LTRRRAEHYFCSTRRSGVLPELGCAWQGHRRRRSELTSPLRRGTWEQSSTMSHRNASGNTCREMKKGLTRVALLAPPQRAPIADRVSEIPPIAQRAVEQQHRTRDHGDDGVLPCISANERGRHSEHAESDRRFAAAVAFDARAATPLTLHDDVVGRPRVEQKP